MFSVWVERRWLIASAPVTLWAGGRGSGSYSRNNLLWENEQGRGALGHLWPQFCGP